MSRRAGISTLVLSLNVLYVSCIPQLSIFDDCKKAYPRLDKPNICAVIFDEDGCEGWSYDVKEGFQVLGSGTSKKNDMESLILKPGCIFTGYDNDDRKGKSITFDATSRVKADGPFRKDDLERAELFEEINAVDCRCGDAARRRSGVQHLTTLGEGGFLGIGQKDVADCNGVIDEFNFGTVDGKPVCAFLFDEEKCKGSKVKVGTGYTGIGFFKKNDAESVLVKPGCVLVGYDHDRSDPSKRGNFATFDATENKKTRIPFYKTLKGKQDLEEEISAVDCACQADSSFPLTGGGSRAAIGNAAQKCKERTFPSGIACMAYDDSDCKLDNWDKAIQMRSGENKAYPGFTFSGGFGDLKHRNTIESVSVKRGCSLEVFSDSDYDGTTFVFKAPPNADLHITLEEHNDSKVRGLDDDIESLKCHCP